MNKLPKQWASTMDVCDLLKVSHRHFHKLKRQWVDAGLMHEGKHYFTFSRSTVRYDLDQVRKLAHSQGRLVAPQSF